MSLGKADGALMVDVEALGWLISLALSVGIPMREVWRQLRGISSERVIGLRPNRVLSVPDEVDIAIERWMLEKDGIQQKQLPGRAGGPTALPPAEVVPVMSAARVVAAGEGQQMMFGGCRRRY